MRWMMEMDKSLTRLVEETGRGDVRQNEELCSEYLIQFKVRGSYHFLLQKKIGKMVFFCLVSISNGCQNVLSSITLICVPPNWDITGTLGLQLMSF